MGKKAIFTKSILDFSNYFVGSRTLHKCYILHIRFDQFFKGNLVKILKVMVLSDNLPS